MRRVQRGEITLKKLPRNLFDDPAAGALGLDRSAGTQIQINSTIEDREKVISVMLNLAEVRGTQEMMILLVLAIKENQEDDSRAIERLQEEVRHLQSRERNRHSCTLL